MGTILPIRIHAQRFDNDGFNARNSSLGIPVTLLQTIDLEMC